MRRRMRGRLVTAMFAAAVVSGLALGNPSALADPEVPLPPPSPIDPAAADPPRIETVDAAGSSATVLEIRAQDRRGLLWRACRALSAVGVGVRSAHVDTLGPQAVDVFYLQEESAGALSEPRAAEAAHAVRAALTPAEDG